MVGFHQPFHQKYRPKNLDELVGQKVISLTLKQAIISNKIAPAYLFCGPRGTGKTSSARIFAKSLNCLSHNEPNCDPCNTCELCKSINDGIALDVIEIDAASNTGVENIREIIERAKFSPTQARWKVYVIDECHMLSTAASNALLKTIEEPPAKVVFILATTNPERVLTTIQSRCQKFEFKRINSHEIYQHLLNISKKESIKYEESAIQLISKRSNGGMRDAQSMLDQLSLLPDGVTLKNVELLLGEVPEKDLIRLIYSLIENKPESLINNCANLYNSGYEPIAILEGLLNITRDLLLTNIDDDYSELFYTSREFHQELDTISKLLRKSTIIKWHNNLKSIEYQIKNSNQPRLWLEINLSSLIEIKEERLVEETNNEGNKQKLAYIENNKDINNKKEEKSHDIESIQLKEKWSLILSKIELPSTRMLLSQQAKLINFDNNSIEIGLSPNWEKMIKSRTPIIENTVKKIFGDQMKINFTISSNIENFSSEKKLEALSKEHLNNQNKETKNQIKKEEINKQSSEFNDKNSSKNLANFFNGEIVDI